MHDVHMCIIWGEILPDSVRRHTKNFFSTPHLRIHMPSKKTQRAATSCALHGEENLRIPPKMISDQQSAGKARCYLQLRFNISNFHTILKNFFTVFTIGLSCRRVGERNQINHAQSLLNRVLHKPIFIDVK